MTRASRGRPPGNLPQDVDSFVGRRDEARQVRRLLGTTRLVTLTGVGGVGKTRLAVRAAGAAWAEFPDGVWLVDFAGFDDPALLTRTIATTLGMRDESGRWPVAALADFLSRQRVLLVLDSCEHLSAACAVLVNTLLHSTPELRILATSRHALSTAGEHILPVRPLSLPPLDVPVTKPADVAGYEAVRLFVDRARAAVPGFTLTRDNTSSVVRLCTHLDGLPLAIELAAVRLRALSLDEIVERLDDRFQLLNRGDPTALPRQRTLDALVGWSYGLCSPGEQALWRAVSVFRGGGFELAAVEAVCARGLPEGTPLVDLLAGLVDKSILMREDGGRHVRYQLLETIRQYGKTQLAPAEELALRHAHRDYYTELAVRAEEAWFGPRQQSWLVRLRLERNNLLDVLRFCLVDPDPTAIGHGLRLATSLWLHWRPLGWVAEGTRWLDRLLSNGSAPAAARAKGLCVSAWLAIIQGDLARASALLQEGATLSRRTGDARTQAFVTQFRGQLAMCRRELSRARHLLDEALAAHHAAGDVVGMGMSRIRLALVLSYLQDGDRALALGDECLTMARTRESPGWAGYAHWIRAVEMWRRGEFATATALANECVRVQASLDDRVAAALGMEVLAWLAAADDRAGRAAQLFGALHQFWRPIGAGLSGYGHLAEYHDRCLRDCRLRLTGRVFDMHFRRGEQMTFTAAVEFALADDRRTSRDALAPLTPREQEIATLVSHGLSDKQIAKRLVISRSTASTHLEHIRAKLGFSSRTQIAVWVNERTSG